MEILREATEFKDVKGILYNSAEKFKDNIAFTIKHKNGKDITYEDIKFPKLLEDINCFGTALFSLGLEDKRVAVIGKNSYEWAVAHLANLLGGIVSVPLDKGLQYEELKLSIIRSKVEAIVFDEAVLDLIEKIREEQKQNEEIKIKHYICMQEIKGYFCLKNMMKQGATLISTGEKRYLEKEIDENKMSILLFTSGTTEKAKAVMLSQRNIASNVYALQCVEGFLPTDTNIAFLPFHHIFGSTCLVMILGYGARTVFPDGLKYIKQNLNEYKVTVFVGVPVLIEAIYKTIMKEVKKQKKELLIKFALRLSNILMFFHIDIRRKIFKQIIDQLGGELRFLISGGAPADPKISKGFNDLGIRIVQGYGLSETAPVIAGENDKYVRNGSVGRELPGIEIRIDNPDEQGIGEICAKGPNVMLGYYEMPEKTKEVIVDGWFHTGDLGYIDKDGFLFITGRKKDLIVLKNGKKVFPDEIETIINRLEIVKESFVYGMPSNTDKNDLRVCVKIVYDNEYRNVRYKDLNAEEFYDAVWQEIKRINLQFPQYKHIQGMILTDKELIKTTTNKVKRNEEMKLILGE